MTPEQAHETVYQLPRGEHQTALMYLLQREREYEAALKGIATSASNDFLAGIARNVLDKHGVKWGFAELGERFPHLVNP